MQIYGNKRKCSHKKRDQLPQEWLEHQHDRRFIVLEHQYGSRDIMCKRSISRFPSQYIIKPFLSYYKRLLIRFIISIQYLLILR